MSVLGPGRGWVLVGALIAAEYLLISFLIDARDFLARGGFDTVLGELGTVAPLTVVVAVAIFVVGGRRLREELTLAANTEAAAGRRIWPFVVAHLAAYGGLVALTIHITAHVPWNAPAGPWWLSAWVLLGVGGVAALVPAACPPRAIAPLLRRASGSLGLGALVGIIAWAAGLATVELWRPLGYGTLLAVALLLRPFVDTLVFIPETFEVGTEQFYVIVAPICSGYEGIGLILVFLGVYLYASRRSLRFPRALVLIPLGVVTVWIGNAVRIAALIAVGTWGSPEVALGGFHSKAGWLFFCIIALGMVALGRRARWLRAPEDAPAVDTTAEEETEAGPTGAYLLPQLGVIATALISGLWVTGLDHGYALRIAVGLGLLVCFRHQYPDLRPSRSVVPALVGLAAFGLWMLLVREPEPGTSSAVQGELEAMGPAAMHIWIITRVVGSVLVMPAVEEIAFRGYVYRRVMSPEFERVPLHRFSWLALGVSSLAFGILHAQWLAGTLVGALFAAAQLWRGRLGDAIVAHAVTNVLVAVTVLVDGQWALWL